MLKLQNDFPEDLRSEKFLKEFLEENLGGIHRKAFVIKYLEIFFVGASGEISRRAPRARKNSS